MRLGFLSVDLVVMSVNDVLLQGAEPLFFLDYFACGKLDVAAGDVVLGLASSGVHSNGFSLVRKCIDRAASSLPTTLDGQPFKQALTAPTRLYVKSVLGALAVHPIKALAHITGGGLL